MRTDSVAIKNEVLAQEIEQLLQSMGSGPVSATAYDTAWVARLAAHYPQSGFDASLEWLRRSQSIDGTWGAPLVQYHDRYVSTLAAIVALQEAGRDVRDQRRVKRGADALWRLIGKLGQDDADTVGFPVVSTALTQDAIALGLDVPQPPIRFAVPYQRKVNALLAQPKRDWRASPLIFSLEALRAGLGAGDQVLEANHSVAASPSATAGFLLVRSDDRALSYLTAVSSNGSHGGAPALSPIDVFDIAWGLTHLFRAGAIEWGHPQVRRALDHLWAMWSPVAGVGTSSFLPVPDIDDTAACFAVLRLAGYPVSPTVFEHYEADEHFLCFHGETNPSVSAHVRFLSALRLCEDYPHYSEWMAKVLNVLKRFDENGSFWWDKWHASPYYVTGAALIALQGLDDDLAASRLKWILHTQNDDGGWGYLGQSTLEETAYCLEALLFWDGMVASIDPAVLDAAAQFLGDNLDHLPYLPLWIGKSLYTPYVPVKAAVLGALFAYANRR